MTQVADIFDRYRRLGHSLYGGEAVSQLDHALQCALAAERAGESDAIVTAALLHDLGHLLDPPTDPSQPERHQDQGADLLTALYPPAVTEVVRLHVDAKRYLCQADPDYWRRLSPESQRTLAYQGGPFTRTQAAEFILQPHAEVAVRVRRYDELAKEVGRATPDLDYYQVIAERVAMG